jgi:hypothetical protein
MPAGGARDHKNRADLAFDDIGTQFLRGGSRQSPENRPIQAWNSRC